MAAPRKYPQELRDRAVRLVLESDRPIAQIAAFWAAASAGGDIDTNCAIVGGIVAARAEMPSGWLESTEPLPSWTGLPW